MKGETSQEILEIKQNSWKWMQEKGFSVPERKALVQSYWRSEAGCQPSTSVSQSHSFTHVLSQEPSTGHLRKGQYPSLEEAQGN